MKSFIEFELIQNGKVTLVCVNTNLITHVVDRVIVV